MVGPESIVRNGAIGKAIEILVSRADEAGASSFLHAKDEELVCQAKLDGKEISRLRDGLEAAERRIRDLQAVQCYRCRSSRSSFVEMEDVVPAAGAGAVTGTARKKKGPAPVSADTESVRDTFCPWSTRTWIRGWSCFRPRRIERLRVLRISLVIHAEP